MRIDFKLLDGIRGLAALYVVINHSRGHLYIGGAKLAELLPVSEWTLIDKLYLAVIQSTILGTEFVILFFILSGFSIAHSLSNKSPALSFFQRRFVRVYPVYILGFIWSLLIFWLLKYSVPEWFLKADDVQANAVLHYNLSFDTPKNILFTLFYIPSGSLIAQYWSLSHEVIFYLFAPLIFTSKRIYYVVSIILYMGSWFWYGVNDASESIIINFLFNYNIFFAVGLFVYDRRETLIQYIPKKKYLAAFVAGLFLIMIATKMLIGSSNKITSMITVTFSLLLIFGVLKYQISNSLLNWIGKFSYTLYVMHLATIYLFKLLLVHLIGYDGDFITDKTIWLYAIPFCVLVAWALYYVAEYPTKVVLERLRMKHSRRTASKEIINVS